MKNDVTVYTDSSCLFIGQHCPIMRIHQVALTVSAVDIRYIAAAINW